MKRWIVFPVRLVTKNFQIVIASVLSIWTVPSMLHLQLATSIRAVTATARIFGHLQTAASVLNGITQLQIVTLVQKGMLTTLNAIGSAQRNLIAVIMRQMYLVSQKSSAIAHVATVGKEIPVSIVRTTMIAEQTVANAPTGSERWSVLHPIQIALH